MLCGGNPNSEAIFNVPNLMVLYLTEVSVRLYLATTLLTLSHNNPW